MPLVIAPYVTEALGARGCPGACCYGRDRSKAPAREAQPVSLRSSSRRPVPIPPPQSRLLTSPERSLPASATTGRSSKRRNPPRLSCNSEPPLQPSAACIRSSGGSGRRASHSSRAPISHPLVHTTPRDLLEFWKLLFGNCLTANCESGTIAASQFTRLIQSSQVRVLINISDPTCSEQPSDRPVSSVKDCLA